MNDLTSAEIEQLKEAFNEWASDPRTPQDAAINMGQDVAAGRRSVVKDIFSRYSGGEALRDLIALNVRRNGIDAVVQDLKNDKLPPPPPVY